MVRVCGLVLLLVLLRVRKLLVWVLNLWLREVVGLLLMRNGHRGG